MTRAAINQSVWFVGLLVQVMLLFAVYRRGIGRSMPLFAALLTFYPMRSLFLRLIASSLAPDTYAVVYDLLSLADIFLQSLVALEIGREIFRAAGDFRLPLVLLTILVLAIVGLATVPFLQLIPTKLGVHPDRFQIFGSLLMILLCVWSFRPSVSTLVRQAVGGLAAAAAVGLVAMVGRNQAAIHHAPMAFTFWAYAVTITYLSVALYWIVFLKQQAAGSGASGALT